jgi:hypothetical protein
VSSVAERGEPPAALPVGWKRVVDRADGFGFGVPPGWRARRTKGGELVRSADGSLAVAIAYDRGKEARELEVGPYAERTARALPGYVGLRAGHARGVPVGRWPAARVGVQGTYRKTRVRQAIVVVVVQRPGRGMFTVLSFRSARLPPSRYSRELSALIGTLGTQRSGRSG